MPSQILVVDAEPAIQLLISSNLVRAGHVASCVDDAESALMQIEAGWPDLLLLEWTLPGQSGISLIRRLRAQAATRDLPIMMVSARSGEPDKILALESGADDYMSKPFSPREMIARVHALLRRPGAATEPAAAAAHGAPVQPLGVLHIDPRTQRVMAGSRQLAMGRVEFKLLNFLMNHPDRVHSRAQLLDQVWGHAVYLDERTVDTHVGRLRSALQPSGLQQHIETVRGSGYRYVAASIRAPL